MELRRGARPAARTFGPSRCRVPNETIITELAPLEAEMTTLMSHADERLTSVRALIRSSTPTTSLYLNAAEPQAGPRELQLRWEAVRRELAEQGAPAQNLAAISVALGGLMPGSRALAAYANEGRLQLSLPLEGYDGPDVAVHGPWPRVVPLLRWEQQRVPAVVAVVGHGLAEATAYDEDGRKAFTETVVGADDEIERNAPGGWSQPRFHRRADDSWMHNAAQFVEHITRLARLVDARLVLIAGDRREVVLVRNRMPAHLRSVTSTSVSARPAEDGGVHVPAGAVIEAVRAAARRERLARIAELDDAVGRRLAAEGPADVRRFLDSGAVRRLIVVNGVVKDELADALVAAALDADSEVVVAEPDDIELAGGVGALLRF